MVNKALFDQFLMDVGNENAIVILKIFYDELTSYINKLNNVTSNEDIKSVAHQIKSSAKSLGALKLSDFSYEIELSALNNDSNLHDKLLKFIDLIEKTKISILDKQKELSK